MPANNCGQAKLQSYRHRRQHLVGCRSVEVITTTQLSQTNRASAATQYVKGIYRPKHYTVTLKSRLRVIRSHWKRNHWVDHTRLTINLLIELFDIEYYRDLEMWVRGHSRSLKMVPFESLGTVSYSPSIVTMVLSLVLSDIFNVKE